jgi:hypothetical protein
MADNSVKILFRFYSDILEEDTTETLQAEVIDKEKGYYKLETIPFHAPLVALGDIVYAKYDEAESILIYRETIQYSGNSTIHVIIMDDQYDIDAIRGIFHEISCLSEKNSNKYFALNVPAKVDYLPIKDNMDQLEKEDIIGYAESCLSENHQYKDYFL